MRPVLFEWGRIKVHSYPFMLYFGIVLGLMAGTRAAALRGLNPQRAYLVLLLLVIPALVGSKILFILSHLHLYRAEPSRAWRRGDGGASLYGGLILAFVVSLPLLKAVGLSVGGFWDCAAVTLLVGMVLTKVGCMLNGCCAGRETQGRIAINLPNFYGRWCRRIPSQLLESGLAGLLLFTALAIWNKLPFQGAFFLVSLFVYAVGRMVLEATRETIDKVGGLSLHRTISAVLAALSLTGFLLLSLYTS